MQTDPPRDSHRDPRRDPAPDAARAPARDSRPRPERPHAQRLPEALSGPRRAAGRPDTRETRPRPGGGRTVVAVLGSVAALGGSAGSAAAATVPSRSGPQAARAARRADPVPPGELALLGLVFAALTAGAPAIARPLLQRGVATETITQADADAFLARLASTGEDRSPGNHSPGARSPVDRSPVDRSPAAASGPAGSGAASASDGFARPTTPAAAALFQTVFDAIRRQLPVIAKPLVTEAVTGGTITPSQARRIEQRLILRAHIRPAGLPGGHAAGHAEPLFTGRLP